MNVIQFCVNSFIGWLGRTFDGRFKIPPLLGMLLVGILIGPSVWNLLDPLTLEISATLRQIALIIILTRAGLSLSLADLKKVGRSAIWMAFLPAIFERVGVVILAPILLGVTRLEAALMGSVLAAVSPAVVVPHMLKVQEEGYGVKKGIPQLIMAGASVDDVFVIVVFTAFLAFREYEILDGYGSISSTMAKDKAHEIYDDFNKTQKIGSDFEKQINQLLKYE